MPLFIPTTAEPSVSIARYTTQELVEEILGHLSGHTIDQGQMSFLTRNMNINDLQMHVDDLSGFSRGIAEVGFELVYVTSVDSNKCVIAPHGRGYRASFPAAWPEGTEVSFAPRFPRSTVLNELNDVISSVFPTIWAVGTTELTTDGVRRTYELPAETADILEVEWKPVGPTGSWENIDRYSFDSTAPTRDYKNGKSITLPHITPGRPVKVTYMARPSALPIEGEFTDTGLSETAWPAVKYGVLHRMAASLTLGMLENDSAQGQEYNRTGQRPVAAEVSDYYRALHQQYLSEEQSRLRTQVSTRVSFRG
ncbi:hypothetical protein [Phytoactinopolyspora halophila]|uniref:hypothetical protein n=1 Tax=Phytoactinopolyspora halophila TaxID=1981511 RepID=UPI000F4D3268|nr:hypothetical protein [Phytoactinopolyspora halophila]